PAYPYNLKIHKSSRQAANRRYYERNRERILQRRRASRIETRARLERLETRAQLEYLERIETRAQLEYLERMIWGFPTHCYPQLSFTFNLSNFDSSQHE
ncbi:2559_t:CDS:2, partial [Racocetra persica]